MDAPTCLCSLQDISQRVSLHPRHEAHKSTNHPYQKISILYIKNRHIPINYHINRWPSFPMYLHPRVQQLKYLPIFEATKPTSFSSSLLFLKKKAAFTSICKTGSVTFFHDLLKKTKIRYCPRFALAHHKTYIPFVSLCKNFTVKLCIFEEVMCCFCRNYPHLDIRKLFLK